MQWDKPQEGTGLEILNQKWILNLFCMSEGGDLQLSAKNSEKKYVYLQV